MCSEVYQGNNLLGGWLSYVCDGTTCLRWKLCYTGVEKVNYAHVLYIIFTCQRINLHDLYMNLCFHGSSSRDSKVAFLYCDVKRTFLLVIILFLEFVCWMTCCLSTPFFYLFFCFIIIIIFFLLHVE